MPKTRRRYIRVSERREVYAKCNGHCAYCGRELAFKDMQVDHVTSLHNHGADEVWNMLPACRECNHYKKACSLEGFRRRMIRAINRKSKCEWVRELCRRYEGWGCRFFFERKERRRSRERAMAETDSANSVDSSEEKNAMTDAMPE